MTTSLKCCSIDLSTIADKLKCIAEPNRLAIIYLLKTQEYCVYDLGKQLNHSHNSLLHHLKTLKAQGLISSRKQGKHTFYGLNKKTYQNLFENITNILKINT